MLVRRSNNHLIARVEKGEKLIASIEEIARSEGLKGAFFYGLGGVSWAELGFYDLEDRRYNFQMFEELMEVSSISGNIAENAGDVFIHAHVSLGKRDYSSIAGHLKEAEVAGTVELMIIPSEEMSRFEDEETGLGLLDL